MHVNVNLMEENVIEINGGITINVDVSVKNIIFAKNMIFGIPLHGKSNDKETKAIIKICNLCNKKFLYFNCLLLITIALLIAVSICCYLIKYKAKQKHLLPFTSQIMN